MNLKLTIPRPIIEAVISQAQAEMPRECCGLLGGADGLVTSFHPLRNQSSQPEVRYFAAPEDLFVTMKEIRSRGEELISIYHSHPRGPSDPSDTDIELAFYPTAVYLIISLAPELEIRAFRIESGAVTEVAIEQFPVE